jgi:hypothetical protein
MIDGKDIQEALGRAMPGWAAFKPDAGGDTPRTLRELFASLDRRSGPLKEAEHFRDDEDDPDDEETGGIVREGTRHITQHEFLTGEHLVQQIGEMDSRLEGPGRRWTDQLVTPRDLAGPKRLPKPPRRPARQPGCWFWARVCRAAWKLAASRGIELGIDHALDSDGLVPDGWPTFLWLVMELESSGWDIRLFFSFQEAELLETGGEAEITSALLPVYFLEAMEHAAPVVELLEFVRQCQMTPKDRRAVRGKPCTWDRLHLPPAARCPVDVDVHAGGGVKAKAKKHLFSQAEIQQAENVFREIVRAGRWAVDGRIPAAWSRAIEGLAAWPAKYGMIWRIMPLDAQYDISRPKALAEFLDAAHCLGQMRSMTDPLVHSIRGGETPFGDGTPAEREVNDFWAELVNRLLGRAQQPLVETFEKEELAGRPVAGKPAKRKRQPKGKPEGLPLPLDLFLPPARQPCPVAT